MSPKTLKQISIQFKKQGDKFSTIFYLTSRNLTLNSDLPDFRFYSDPEVGLEGHEQAIHRAAEMDVPIDARVVKEANKRPILKRAFPFLR